jgi:3-phosphoshikimate 1-carboxyvinyltransferase
MSTLPNILEIKPLTKPPDCTITVPGSKSITNRALILAALSKVQCTLRGALWADDTQVMVDSLQRLGFEVSIAPDPAESANRTITLIGQSGTVPKSEAEIYVGNAGTAARFLTALVANARGTYRITCDPRMSERPMAELFNALRQLGAGIDGDRLPATIHARGLRRDLRVTVSASESSQFASALRLLDVPVQMAESGEALAYVEMTERMKQGFTPDYAIEPDLSSASYFVAAGQVTGGRVMVRGWPDKSLQVDGRFPEFLPVPPRISRRTDLGDSVMTLVICALFGREPLRLVDGERLRVQECDRISAMATELKRVGAKVEEHPDGLTVWPAQPGQLHGADIETYNDHRMAMCFAVLGLKVPGIRIKNPGCVSKTFPNFFDKLEQLRR